MRLKKSLGQHLLTDSSFLRRIADSSGAALGALCLEIGPGSGNLTAELLALGADVAAVELDREMIPRLQRRFAKNAGFSVLQADILTASLEKLVPESRRPAIAVGNLPYYISSPIVFRLLEFRRLFSSITILVQKEVAARIAAGPGSRDYGMLSVFCGVEGSAEVLFDVPPDAFTPPPDVVSSVVRIIPAPHRNRDIEDFRTFEMTVRAAFNHRRKLLMNSMLISMEKGAEKDFFTPLGALRPALEKAMEEASIPQDMRAEQVSVEQYILLSNRLRRMISS